MWFKDFQIKEKTANGKKYARLEMTKALTEARFKVGDTVVVVASEGLISIKRKQYEI